MPNIAQKPVRVRSGNGAFYDGKAVFVQANWPTNDALTLSLNLNPQQSAGISLDHVESVFIDNSANGASVQVVVTSPPQTVTVAPGGVSNIHLDVSGLQNPVVLRTGYSGGLGTPSGPTSFIFRDYPVGASSTLITGANQSTTTTDTNLQASEQTDPSDNHAAIRTRDLGANNVLAAISQALGGTLKTADTTLDGLVSGGKLPVSDAATVQLAALIASGKLAVSDATLEALISGGKLGVADASAATIAGLISGGKLPVTDATLEALISGGKLAVTDAVLDAIISGGKLAVTDGLLEAALRGATTTSRFAAQLVDASANPFGTLANPLSVNAGPSSIAAPQFGFLSTAGGAYYSTVLNGPGYVVAANLYNSTTSVVAIILYDANSASQPGAVSAARWGAFVPAGGTVNVVFPEPLYFAVGIQPTAQSGINPASGYVTTATIAAGITFHT